MLYSIHLVINIVTDTHPECMTLVFGHRGCMRRDWYFQVMMNKKFINNFFFHYKKPSVKAVEKSNAYIAIINIGRYASHQGL